MALLPRARPARASPVSSSMTAGVDHGPAVAGRGKTNRRRKPPMAESENITRTMDVEETIGRMEQLYQTLTGSSLPRTEVPYSPIPAEKDPAEHVEKQLNRLLTLLGDLGGDVRPLPLTSWTPAMSVWESHTQIRIC